MIEININDPFILIKPFDDRSFPDAAILYNSGNGIRYATGMDGFVPISEIESRLGHSGQGDNCFTACIYLQSGQETPGGTGTGFAGMVSGIVSGGAVWLRQLSVLPAHRRKGIGSRAAQLVFEHLRQYRQASEAFISVIEDNIPGLRFWKKLGFIEISRVEKELFDGGHKYKVIIMQRKL